MCSNGLRFAATANQAARIKNTIWMHRLLQQGNPHENGCEDDDCHRLVAIAIQNLNKRLAALLEMPMAGKNDPSLNVKP